MIWYLIAHIAEISRKKGHLEPGYRNLFEYCTRRLHLSEGSVALQIQVANVSRRFPQILVVLAENRMSLTVAGLLSVPRGPTPTASRFGTRRWPRPTLGLRAHRARSHRE